MGRTKDMLSCLCSSWDYPHRHKGVQPLIHVDEIELSVEDSPMYGVCRQSVAPPSAKNNLGRVIGRSCSVWVATSLTKLALLST